ncbi:CinA family protein [Rhodopirellula sp. JC639]|uniref:CinA family protein n=1 Tax=Stieleria mannarensis TaxID=2755585 RepID=UPI0016010AC8|nr:nicotinamide-nucleotide amidohydrolase family protein [Rhodopirellula sp. JC639]
MDLDSQARRLVELLGEKRQTLVLAESCTGGLIAATLATIPGVSAWLAGSLVVYQEASKQRWLGVAEETLAEHTAVSAPVAHQMVAGALHTTPHADLAASVTGHLGPNAPAEFDGLIYVGVGRRGQPPRTWGVELKAPKRVGRQRESALVVIDTLIGVLERLE